METISTANVPSLVRRLVDGIDDRWAQARYDESAFPEIAASELTASDLIRDIGAEDLFAWALTTDDLPQQRYRKFGDPPLNLYVGPRFFVECLVWLDGKTGIHEHSFSGAFAVLHGRSIHVTYEFAASHEECTTFVTGSARVLDAEILSRGCVRKIVKGPALTHALYHIEAPTLTIVVRTDGSSSTDQHAILFPRAKVLEHIAEPQETLVRLMTSLSRSNVDLFEKYFSSSVRTMSAYATFKIVYFGLRHPGLMQRIAANSEPKLRERLSILIRIAEEQTKISNMSEVVRNVGDDELRFFAALLLNVPDRSRFLFLLAETYPTEQPVSTASRMLEALAANIYKIEFGGTFAAFAASRLSGENCELPGESYRKVSKVWEALRQQLFLGAFDVESNVS